MMRVLLEPEHARLFGRVWPPQRMTLYLTRDRQRLPEYPEAEWIAPGSGRLAHLIELTRERGRAGRGYLSRPPTLAGAREEARRFLLAALGDDSIPASWELRWVYRPWLHLTFHLRYRALEVWERLVDVEGDLVSGEIFPGVHPRGYWDLLRESPEPGLPVLARRVPYRRIFEAAVESVARLVAAEPAAWAEEAARLIQLEMERLEEHYRKSGREADEAVVAAERQARLAEQRSQYPRVLLRPALALCLYRPVLLFTPPGGARLTELPAYDPLAGRILGPARPSGRCVSG